MKIGLKIKYTKNVSAILPHLDRLGKALDHFEIGTRPEENFKDYEPLKRAGIGFAVHAPMQENNVNPAEPLKDMPTHKGLKIAQEAADYFNAPVIVIHPGDIETKNSSIEHMVELFKEYSDKRFYLENLPDKARTLPFDRIAYKIDDLRRVKEESGMDFCLDFGHALVQSTREGKEFYGYIEEIVKKLEPKYFHLHNGDGKSDKHWQITDKRGVIDYKRIIPLFPQDAVLTLEVYVFTEGNGFNIEGILRDVDYLRS